MRNISQGTDVWCLMRNYLTPKLSEGETVDLSLYSPRERTNIRLYGLAFKDYTLEMLDEYKVAWAKKATVVKIRGGLDTAKKWCRTNCFHQDFEVHKHPGGDPTCNMVAFKNPQEAMLFKLSHKFIG